MSLCLSLYSHTNKPPHITITSLQLPIKSLRTHTIYSVYVTKESKNVRQMKPNTSCLFTCTVHAAAIQQIPIHNLSLSLLSLLGIVQFILIQFHIHYITLLLSLEWWLSLSKIRITTPLDLASTIISSVEINKHKNCMSTVYPVPALATTSQEVTISCQ